MTDKIVHLTRHAQAEHNVEEDYSIFDARLTPLGRQQAKKLHETTKDNIQKRFQVIVSSPLSRTLQTTLDGYPDAIERLGGKGKIVLLPQAQEANDLPCDRGRSRAELEKEPEFEGLDLSSLTDDWNSKEGQYASNVKTLQARARYVRRFLRDRQEKELVLVAHGDILRYIAFGKQDGSPWANTETRSYRFKSNDDDDAWLKQIDVEAKEGTNEPTSGEMASNSQYQYSN